MVGPLGAQTNQGSRVIHANRQRAVSVGWVRSSGAALIKQVA
jgi:hypothetical protein